MRYESSWLAVYIVVRFKDASLPHLRWQVRTYRGFFASARGRKARLEAFEELSRCRDPAVVVDILNVILSRKKWFDIKGTCAVGDAE